MLCLSFDTFSLCIANPSRHTQRRGLFDGMNAEENAFQVRIVLGVGGDTLDFAGDFEFDARHRSWDGWKLANRRLLL